jgi:hypothetical protein
MRHSLYRARLVIGATAALMACGGAANLGSPPPPPPPAQPVPANAALGAPPVRAGIASSAPLSHVIFISIDGLGYELLHDRDALGLRIPELRALLAEGASGSLTPVTPSLTYPNHVTMMTGVLPAAHGIYNNFTFDPLEKNKDGWHWYARDVRAPLLWDQVRRAGGTTGSVYFPVTVGAQIDWNVPQFWRAETAEDEKLVHALTTPELARELDEAGLPMPGEHSRDTLRGRIASHIWERHTPNLLLTYFEDLDTASHEFGPRSQRALDALEQIDIALGELRSAVAQRGVRATWIIVSDHGFRSADKSVRPGVALREAGLVTLTKSGKISGWQAMTWRGNGLCAVYMNPTADAAQREKAIATMTKLASDKRNGVARILDAEDLARLGAFPGALLALEAAPGFMFNKGFDGPLVRPSEERGAHGYDAAAPDMAGVLIVRSDTTTRRDLGTVPMSDVATMVTRELGLRGR